MSMKKYFQELVQKRLEKKMETPRQRGLRMEPLEDRMLLTATPNDWDAVKNLEGSTSGAVDLVLKVANPETDRQVVLGLMVEGKDGFVPKELTITPNGDDSASVIKSITNYGGENKSFLIVKLTPGADNLYQEQGFKLHFEGASAGNFSCCAFTPGSLEGDQFGFIDDIELDECMKYIVYTNAYMQGNRNPMSIALYQSLYGENVDLTKWENVYHSVYDINMDGIVTNDDMALMEKGLTSGMTVSLDWFDRDAPTIPTDPALWGGAVTGSETEGFSVQIKQESAFFVPIQDKSGVASVDVVAGGTHYDGVYDKTAGRLTGVKVEGQTKTLAELFDVAAKGNGEYALTVQATDVVGNKMENPVSVTFLYVSDTLKEEAGKSASMDTSLLLSGNVDGLKIQEGDSAAKTFAELTAGVTPAKEGNIWTYVCTLDSGAALTLVCRMNGEQLESITNATYDVTGRVKPGRLSEGESEQIKITFLQEASSADWKFNVIGVNAAPVGSNHTATVNLINNDVKFDDDKTSLNLLDTVTDDNRSDTVSFVADSIVIPADVKEAVTIDQTGNVSLDKDKLAQIYIALPENETAVFTITYKVQDNHGAETTITPLSLAVTVIGKNEAPTAKDITGTIDAEDAGRIVFTWDGSDPDTGEAAKLKLNAVKISGTEYTIVNGQFKAGEAAAVNSVTVSDAQMTYGTYSLEDGNLVYTLSDAYQEKLKWETSDAGAAHTAAVNLGGLQYQLADPHDAASNFASVSYTYNGDFDELANLNAPDQEVNALGTETSDFPLDKKVTFSSDTGEKYAFTIESVTKGEKTIEGLLSFDNANIKLGQNGEISIIVSKSVLNTIDPADYGVYTVSYSYENINTGRSDSGEGTFNLSVVGYELTVEPGTIGAGSLTEDEVYDPEAETPKQIAVDLTEKITSVKAKKTGESEGTAVSSYKFSTELTLSTIQGTGAEKLSKSDFSALATIDADGNLTFRLTDAASGKLQYLDEGDSVTLTYQYKLTNIKIGEEEIAGTFNGGLVTIVLNGANDAPTAGTVNITLNDTTASGTVKSGAVDVEGNPLSYETQSGSIKYFKNGTDVTDTYAQLIVAAAQTGWLTNSEGTYTYTNQEVFKKIPNGVSAVITYTVKVSDSHGAWTNETVAVTITGTNQAPTADALDNVSVDAGELTDVNWSAKASDIDALDTVSLSKIVYNGTDYTPAAESQKIEITGGKVNGNLVSGKAGDFGYLTLNADGTISFTATGDYLKWHLASGDLFTFTFNYAVKDALLAESNATAVTVTVAGQTDNAVFTLPEQMTVTNKATAGEGGWVKISGDMTYQFDKGQSYDFAVKQVGTVTDPTTLAADFKIEKSVNTETGIGTVTLYIQKSAMTGDTPLFDVGTYDVKIGVSGGALAEGDEVQSLSLAVKDKGALETKTTSYESAIGEKALGTFDVDVTGITYTDPDDSSIPVTDVTYQNAAALPAAITLTVSDTTYTTKEDINAQFGGKADYDTLIAALASKASMTDGVVTFTNSANFFDFLAQGMTLNISYTYTISSYTSNGTKWEIPSTGIAAYAITGVNDAPTVEAVAVGNISDGTSQVIDWKGASSDVDAGAVLTLSKVNGVAVTAAAGSDQRIDINGGADGYFIVSVVSGEQVLTYYAAGGNITALKGGETKAFSATFAVKDEKGAETANNISMTWVGKVDFADDQEADILFNEYRVADADNWIAVGTLETSDGTLAADYTLTDAAGLSKAVANADNTYTVSVKKDALNNALASGELAVTFGYTNAGGTDTGTVGYTVNITAKGTPASEEPEAESITEDYIGTVVYDDLDENWSDDDMEESFAVDFTGASISSVALSEVAGKTFDEEAIKNLGAISGTTFTFTNSKALFQQLGEGELLIVTYTYSLTAGYTTDGVKYNQPLSGTVSVIITGVNDAPTGLKEYKLTYDLSNPNPSAVSANLLDGVTDPEGDTLTASIKEQTAGFDISAYTTVDESGIFKIKAGQESAFFTALEEAYKSRRIGASADTDALKNIVLTYQVSDGKAAPTNTITITVVGKNESPIAADSSLTVDLATGDASAVKVIQDDGSSDPDIGDKLTAAVQSVTEGGQPLTGVVTISEDGSSLVINKARLKELYPTLPTTQSKTITVNYSLTDDSGVTATQTDAGTVILTVQGFYEAPSFIGKFDNQELTYQGTGETGDDTISLALEGQFKGAYIANKTVITLYDGSGAGAGTVATLAYTETETTVSTDRFIGTYWMTNDGGNVAIHLKSNAYTAGLNASDLYAVISVKDSAENSADSNRFKVSLTDDQRSTTEFFLFATNRKYDEEEGEYVDHKSISTSVKTIASVDGTAGLYKLDMSQYSETLRKGSIDGNYGELDGSGNYVYELEIWVYDTSKTFTASTTGFIGYALQLEPSENVKNISVIEISGFAIQDYADGILQVGTSVTSPLKNMTDGFAYRLGKVLVTVAATESQTMATHTITTTVEGNDTLSFHRKVNGGDIIVNKSQIKCGSLAYTQKIVGLAGTEYLTDNGFYIRTVDAATEVREDGTIAELGTNADFLNEWQTHYTEVWVKGSDLTTYLGAAAQISFNSDYFTVSNVTFGDFFGNGKATVDTETGTISLAALADGGSFSTDGLILLARVAYQSGEDQGVNWDNSFSPISLEWEITSADLFTAGDAVDVYIGQKQIVELWGNPYDVDDDGVITISDFAKFAIAFGDQIITDSTYNVGFDYNRDGSVDIHDFSKFAVMFGTKKEEVVSGKKQVIFPETFNQRYIGSTLNADSQQQIGMVFDAANDAWAEALGLSETVSVTLVVSDLEGDTLAKAQVTKTDDNGRTTDGIIYLDSDAAGHYWYSQTADPVDASRYDLYTVLLHELGHFYGYDFASEAYTAAQDVYTYLEDDGHSANTEDVMYYGINLGQRKELTENDAQAAEAILGSIASGTWSGSEVGTSTEIAAFGAAAGDAADAEANSEGVEISGGWINSSAVTLMSTDAAAAQILIDAKSQLAMAEIGLDIEGAQAVAAGEPQLVRDQVIEEVFAAAETEDDETDDFSFVENKDEAKYSEAIESVWTDEWLF